MAINPTFGDSHSLGHFFAGIAQGQHIKDLLFPGGDYHGPAFNAPGEVAF